MLEQKKECGGEEIYMGRFYKVFECAEKCRSISSMFLFGTKGHGSTKCDESGCKCYCETESTNVGTCQTKDAMGYDLYTYMKPHSGK